MSEKNISVRLSKAAREFNVGISTITEFLSKKGFTIDSSPNTKLNAELYTLIQQEYSQEKSAKEESIKVGLEHAKLETISLEDKRDSSNQDDSDDISIEDLLTTSTSAYSKTPSKKVTAKKKKVDVTPEETEKGSEEKTVEEKTDAPKETPVNEVAVEKDPEPAKEVVQMDEPAVIDKTSDEKETSGKEAASDKEETADREAALDKEKAADKQETSDKEVATEKEETSDKEVAAEKEETSDKEEVSDGKEVSRGSKGKKDIPIEASGDGEDDGEDDGATSVSEPSDDISLKVHGIIDLDSMNMRTKPKRKTKAQKDEEQKLKKEVERRRKAAVRDKGKGVEPPVSEEAPQDEQPRTVAEPEKPAEETSEKAAEKAKPEVDKNFLETKIERLSGPTILGKMDLPSPVRRIKKIEKKQQPVASSDEGTVTSSAKKKRKRIKPEITKGGAKPETKPGDKKQKTIAKKRSDPKVPATEEDIQKQIKDTLARLSPTGKSKSSKFRRQKREQIHQNLELQRIKEEDENRIIKVTEFVTVAELASLMNVDVNSIIATCIQLGLFVSINQRLDAETLTIVASEFGHELEFVGIEAQESVTTFEDDPADLVPRNPIVTVMGHVDHGKTSLLDYIRNTNVIAGEAGGITQHIGAYEVEGESGKKITFLDTPGHEAFTAMRARGAKVTDIAIIVVAADDQVMPQTREAINHAQAAGVPLVFAINKIDKPGANPEKVKEQLASMNLLVEDWGGKYQSHDISAKQGLHIEELLEKVLLEAELLDLKCNPKRPAEGTVIESSLDKGRGFIAKLLVQNGTLKTGDVVIAGCFHGRVKAMYNERNQKINEAGPGAPVLLLGLHGAPQAGDIFNVMSDEKEAKAIASKRLQLQREQGIRTQKHITLDEIGRRIAIGDFKELNIIVKGDVDGSVEALSDSLMKLSTDQAQVNVIHKSVGAVSETDVMLASASDAIIVAFQVRPSLSARKLAEQEQIDIRLYSIIYQAIDEIRSALEGMLAPDIEEKITSNVEVREVFKITKVGTIAGCMVLDGKINKNSNIRVIRDGIVVYTGRLGSLKRFKDDVKEVSTGYECGLNIDNFNDIKVGDIVESYEETEVKRKL